MMNQAQSLNVSNQDWLGSKAALLMDKPALVQENK
jgi:hypothetical protein